MGTASNPRAALRDAIETYQAALADMHRAEVTLAKARQLHCDLVAKRADAFQNLDDQIAAARASNLKRALDDDADAPLAAQEPPPGFAAAKITRENLDDQIQGVADSLGVLQDELEQAQRHAVECDYRLDLAREAVFCDEAEALADDFMQKLMDVRRMSMRLRFMAMRQVKRGPSAHRLTGPFYGEGASRTITMSPLVNLAIHEECMGDFDRRGGLKLRDDVGRATADWWARLRVDPLARFDVDEALDEARQSLSGVMVVGRR